jgi:hypothetical protein
MYLPGRALRSGNYVFTPRSSGGSSFGLQSAVAAGAAVVITTSRVAKAGHLEFWVRPKLSTTGTIRTEAKQPVK